MAGIEHLDNGSKDGNNNIIFSAETRQPFIMDKKDYNVLFVDNDSYNGAYAEDIYNNNTALDNIYYILSEPHEILALTLSCIAITLNVLSLLAISQIKNRITTHHRLIISLCVSDMLIGITVCLNTLNMALNPHSGGNTDSLPNAISSCFYMIIKALNSTALNVSLFNLMMMAIDHFIAIIKPMHYLLHMRTSRNIIIILTMWLVALLLGFSDFFSGYNRYYVELSVHYCEAVYLSLYNEEFLVFIVAAVTSVIMVYIYTRIYCKIRTHKSPGVQLRTTSEMKRNKRAMMTTLLILGTFMGCWMPTCIYQIALIIQIHVDMRALQKAIPILYVFDKYLYNVLLINSIADPIIYAVRMYDVQLGYKRLFRNCCPCLKYNDGNSYTWEKGFTRNGGSNSNSRKSQNGERSKTSFQKMCILQSSNKGNSETCPLEALNIDDSRMREADEQIS